jgi:HEAT repeat protein
MLAELRNNGVSGIIRMIAKRLLLVILVLAIPPMMGQKAGISQDEPAVPTPEGTIKATADAQPELYSVLKDQLTNKVSTLQMRINAAGLLLSMNAPQARQILLDVLKKTDNSAARVAVCRALSEARIRRKPIISKGDFIQPLLAILTADDPASPASPEDRGLAKLAAEATLIYDYGQIAGVLKSIAADSSLPARARLNAIYALKLQPDMRAAVELVRLLDDPDVPIAAAAEKALNSLGIAAGEDAEARKALIAEIERKGNETFLREQMVRQGDLMRQLETEREMWRNQYLAALDKYYDRIKDDKAVRDGLLAEQLAASETAVKLWALEKVSQLAIGQKSLAELGPRLLSLLSDENREVRLRTAALLPLIGGVDPAEKLLEQHGVEKDDEVKTEIFVALGVVCSSPAKVSPDIRKQVLEWAGEYLAEPEPKKAQRGAEVIRRLLQGNALPYKNSGKYLGMLAGRYGQEKNKPDGALRAGLLNTMAGLCAQQSACKAESAKLFEPLFEEALADKTDMAREAAVDGLINIDKTGALVRVRKVGLFNDPRVEISRKVVNLAGEVGGKEDLVWLWQKTGLSSESNLAWESMLNILKRSDLAVLSEWMAKFDSLSASGALSDDQRLSALKIAEQKLTGAGRADMLKNVIKQLAQLYGKMGNFEQKAKYLGSLNRISTTDGKEMVLPGLLDAYLRWPNIPMAAELVNNCLLEKDLDPNDPVVRVIEQYFSEPPSGVDANAVLVDFLAQVKTPVRPRPNWERLLARWADRLARPRKPIKADS